MSGEADNARKCDSLLEQFLKGFVSSSTLFHLYRIHPAEISFDVFFYLFYYQCKLIARENAKLFIKQRDADLALFSDTEEG